MWRSELGGSQPRCGLMGRSDASHWAMSLPGADVLQGDRFSPLLLGGSTPGTRGLVGSCRDGSQSSGWLLVGGATVPDNGQDLRTEFLHGEWR